MKLIFYTNAIFDSLIYIAGIIFSFRCRHLQKAVEYLQYFDGTMAALKDVPVKLTGRVVLGIVVILAVVGVICSLLTNFLAALLV